MSIQKYLLLVGLLCLFACQKEKNQTADIMTKIDQIPALLDRPEKIRYGKEWEHIQNLYVDKRNEILNQKEALEARQKLAEVYINEARITGEHGHYYPAALQMADEILSKNPEDKDLRFMALSTKAGVQLSLHQFDEAKKSGEEALALNPFNAQIFGVLVDANVEMGEYETAVQMAERMMSIRPDLRSYSRVSYLREIHGDIEGAKEALQMAVASGHPALEETAWAKLTLGELYQNYGDLTRAAREYQAILQHRPNHPFAIAALASIHFEKKEYEDAEKLLQEAVSIIPEVGFYIQLGELYQLTDREEKSEQVTAKILTMLEDDLQSGHNMNLELANVFAKLKKDPEKALEYALKEYRIRPKNIDVNRKLACIYAQIGDQKNADNHLVTAASTNSKHPELLALSEK